jgi:phosphate transport system substrate-binding protein
MAEELDYVPLPTSLVSLISETWKKEIKDTSGKAVWN